MSVIDKVMGKIDEEIQLSLFRYYALSESNDIFLKLVQYTKKIPDARVKFILLLEKLSLPKEKFDDLIIKFDKLTMLL